MTEIRRSAWGGKVAEALRWSAGWRIVQQGGRFLVSVVLARTLLPDDYGLFGLVALVTGLVGVVNGLGLAPSIVQRRDLSAEHLTAAFWLSQAVGLGLAILVAALSPLVAWFFREPRVAWLLAAASLELILGALVTVQSALLMRELSFRQAGLYSAPGVIGGWAASIGLALAGAGAWSLVAGSLTTAAIQVIVYWSRIDWRPGWRFGRRQASELLGFGANVTGSRVLGFANSNLDYLMIGRFLGTASLGIYTLAYQLITFPQNQVATAVTSVMFPAYAAIQDDNERLRRVYLRTLRLLALVGLPALAGLAIVAPEFIQVVYGGKWQGAAGVVQVLCLLGMMYLLGTTVGSVIEGKGKPEIELRWNLAKLALFLAGFAVAIRWGTLGIAWAAVIIVGLGSGWLQGQVNSLIDLAWRDYLNNLRRPIAVTLGMAAVVTLARQASLAAGVDPWVTLAGSIGVGAVSYGLGMWLLEWQTVRAALEFAWSK